MNQVDYDRWWPLHLSVARGEPLSESDQQLYICGLSELQQSEEPQIDFGLLETARRVIADLERQGVSLRARRDALESEIAATEAALNQRSRQVLGAKE